MKLSFCDDLPTKLYNRYLNSNTFLSIGYIVNFLNNNLNFVVDYFIGGKPQISIHIYLACRVHLAEFSRLVWLGQAAAV